MNLVIAVALVIILIVLVITTVMVYICRKNKLTVSLGRAYGQPSGFGPTAVLGGGGITYTWTFDAAASGITDPTFTLQLMNSTNVPTSWDNANPKYILTKDGANATEAYVTTDNKSYSYVVPSGAIDPGNYFARIQASDGTSISSDWDVSDTGTNVTGAPVVAEFVGPNPYCAVIDKTGSSNVNMGLMWKISTDDDSNWATIQSTTFYFLTNAVDVSPTTWGDFGFSEGSYTDVNTNQLFTVATSNGNNDNVMTVTISNKNTPVSATGVPYCSSENMITYVNDITDKSNNGFYFLLKAPSAPKVATLKPYAYQIIHISTAPSKSSGTDVTNVIVYPFYSSTNLTNACAAPGLSTCSNTTCTSCAYSSSATGTSNFGIPLTSNNNSSVLCLPTNSSEVPTSGAIVTFSGTVPNDTDNNDDWFMNDVKLFNVILTSLSDNSQISYWFSNTGDKAGTGTSSGPNITYSFSSFVPPGSYKSTTMDLYSYDFSGNLARLATLSTNTLLVADLPPPSALAGAYATQ